LRQPVTSCCRVSLGIAGSKQRSSFHAAANPFSSGHALACIPDSHAAPSAVVSSTLGRCTARVKLKPFIQRADGTAKGDWDLGITLDAVEYAKDADVLVLVSGDGDFALLVDKLRDDFNVSVEVYGVSRLTSNSLINAASRYFPIDGDLLLK
jgi:hypothetical protein